MVAEHTRGMFLHAAPQPLNSFFLLPCRQSLTEPLAPPPPITTTELTHCNLNPRAPNARTATTTRSAQIVGIVYSVFDMRGHVDMDHIEKQFDDSRKQMDMDDTTLEKKLAEAESAKRLADALAAKLLVENSQLLKRVQELEAENAELRGNSNKRK